MDALLAGPTASTTDADPPKMKVKMFCGEREEKIQAQRTKIFKEKKLSLLAEWCFFKDAV